MAVHQDGRDAGAKLSISIDADSRRDYGLMRFGAVQARRGWCEKGMCRRHGKPRGIEEKTQEEMVLPTSIKASLKKKIEPNSDSL